MKNFGFSARPTLIRMLSVCLLWASRPVLAANHEASVDESVGAIEHVAEIVGELSAQLNARTVRVRAKKVGWDELEEFHAELLQTMAMDPVIGDNNAALSAAAVEKTYQLKARFAALTKLKGIAKEYGAEGSFARYSEVVAQVLTLRDQHEYTQARAILKKALFAGVFQELSGGLHKNMSPLIEASVAITPQDRATLSASLTALSSNVQELKSEIVKNSEARIASREAYKKNQELIGEYEARVAWVRLLVSALVALLVATAALGAYLAISQRRKLKFSHAAASMPREAPPSSREAGRRESVTGVAAPRRASSRASRSMDTGISANPQRIVQTIAEGFGSEEAENPSENNRAAASPIASEAQELGAKVAAKSRSSRAPTKRAMTSKEQASPVVNTSAPQNDPLEKLFAPLFDQRRL